jgi:hypothetical protein
MVHEGRLGEQESRKLGDLDAESRAAGMDAGGQHERARMFAREQHLLARLHEAPAELREKTQGAVVAELNAMKAQLDKPEEIRGPKGPVSADYQVSLIDAHSRFALGEKGMAKGDLMDAIKSANEFGKGPDSPAGIASAKVLGDIWDWLQKQSFTAATS